MKECINSKADEKDTETKKSGQGKTCKKRTAKGKDGIDLEHLTPEESLKLEIAAEIGVYDKVIQGGWRSLTSKESGRIGGMMTKRKKEAEKKSLSE